MGLLLNCYEMKTNLHSVLSMSIELVANYEQLSKN